MVYGSFITSEDLVVRLPVAAGNVHEMHDVFRDFRDIRQSICAVVNPVSCWWSLFRAVIVNFLKNKLLFSFLSLSSYLPVVDTALRASTLTLHFRTHIRNRLIYVLYIAFIFLIYIVFKHPVLYIYIYINLYLNILFKANRRGSYLIIKSHMV